jgi:hypothetical protein
MPPWSLSCRAFYENMDKILIFRWLSWGRCRVFEGGLFVYRSRPCIRACITPGFSKTPLELIHIYQLPSESYAERSSAK